MDAEATAIKINNLSKRYASSEHLALNKLSLAVKPGEVYGFLGANGAGKSTTIRTLLNFIQPTSGSATICGLDIVKDSVAVKKHVGYLAGEVALYSKMTGRQFLNYMSDLQPASNANNLNKLVKRLTANLSRPIHELSKGNRQKLGLIQAFMHQPDVLILDEPTSGLDPLMQEQFFEMVNEAKSRGAAIFVSSHNFAEVQRMCDRVGFLHAGELVAEKTLEDLATKAAHTLKLTFADTAPVAELKRLPRVKVTSHDAHHLSVSLEGELTPLFKVLARHHVTRLEQQEVNLEEEFLHLYQKGGQ